MTTDDRVSQTPLASYIDELELQLAEATAERDRYRDALRVINIWASCAHDPWRELGHIERRSGEVLGVPT
jgi:hypothetical protein